MKRKVIFSGILLVSLLWAGVFVVSCSTKKETVELSITGSPVSVPAGSGTATFTVYSNASWAIYAGSDWVSVQPASGAGNATITVQVTENTGANPRTANLSVSAGSLLETVRVTQDGTQSTLLVDASDIPDPVPPAGGNYTARISGNLAWTVDNLSAETWCSVSPEAGTGSATLTIGVAGNETASPRTCTLAVTAGSLSRLIIIAQSATTGTPDYYARARGKAGAALLTALYNIINDHTVVSYNQLWTLYHVSDTMHHNGEVYIWDMYSAKADKTANYYYRLTSDNQCGNYTKEGDCYNREHSVPKSWFNDRSPMYSDAFHIIPTDGFVNSKRGNHPFGEVATASWTSSNGSKVGTAKSGSGSGTVFEPIDAYKGDLARNYFYMATRYMNECSSWDGGMFGTSSSGFETWAATLLLRWHRSDPVSQKENNRNEEIHKVQNNRNPFIDHPELVEYIWGDHAGEAWQ